MLLLFGTAFVCLLERNGDVHRTNVPVSAGIFVENLKFSMHRLSSLLILSEIEDSMGHMQCVRGTNIDSFLHLHLSLCELEFQNVD